MLDEPAERAEQDLFELCRRKCVVGYEGGRPVEYPYLSLSPPIPLPARDKHPDLGWSRAHWGTAEHVLGKARQINERLAAYAGWLSIEPPFLEAVQGLQARWKKLPDHLRPEFPLRRVPVVTVAPEGSSPAPDEVRSFASDLTSLFGRWGLIGMATWDLPLPQGPLLPSLLPEGSAALPAEGIHLILPVHYPLTGDDGLLTVILEQQQSLAERLGLDASVAGLPHYKIYARLLKVLHHERTITGRYARAVRPRGSVKVMVGALADGLNLSDDQVERLRKAISACRRGQRAEFARLRPRSH